MTHRILALWCVPRSRSTAFERMMEQRGDYLCYHEPFGDVWYNGEKPSCRPQRIQNRTPGLTVRVQLERLSISAKTTPVFFKDMAEHVIPYADKNFLQSFDHSFLIRDPADTIPSLFDKWPDFELSETGFSQQNELFQRISDFQGHPPPVIDAEELVAKPLEVISSWCNAVGIDVRPDSLTWPAEAHTYSWYEGGSWHDNLRNSTSLSAPERNYLPLESSQKMLDAYSLCRPHYEELSSHRLQH